MLLSLVAGLCVVNWSDTAQVSSVRVKDVAGLRLAVSRAVPGSKIVLEAGEYAGGVHFSNLRGTADRPIVITGADPGNRPRFVGGNSAIQLSDVSHIEIRDISIEGATQNGLNIDDGGTYDSPTHHLKLVNLRIVDLPKGNHDGIKLSGVDDFEVLDCKVERWGGSAVDMVGCHRGLIKGCSFLSGGDSGVQCKGGSSTVTVTSCRFEDFGQRGVNIGGSTGLTYFRPPVESIPTGQRYEAKDVRVEGCTFVRGVCPTAFVGVDGAVVRFNTIYDPERWALRILQETATADFVPCRNGAFEDNLVVFRSDRWTSGGTNVGPGTLPSSFKFSRNCWYCEDRPERSAPTLPTREADALVGRDPLFLDAKRGNVAVQPGSPALLRGAHAFQPE